MNLLSALDSPGGLVCVVGGGGKTTTMYALASRVDNAIVTATVRIPRFDRSVSELIVTETPTAVLDEHSKQAFPLGLVPETEGKHRYRGYEPETVDAIAERHDGPVFVKSDGARMRDFKAPAAHEPRIPDSTDLVVPVVSSHVVGKPLTGHWVHRPDRVSELTETEMGDEITPDTVGRVLAHPDGGFRNVPEGTTVIPLITKVDGEEHEQAANAIATAVYDHLDDSSVEVPRVAFARFDAFDAVEHPTE